MNIRELAGEKIEGRYELEELLGAGAMGAVYRARQNVVNRSVAVKILHPDIVREDPDFRMRFEREAEALGKLEHPNLVTVHDFGWWPSGQTPYMVTQFAGGDTLHAHMPAHLGDPRFAVSMLLEIARGLAHAHDRGVVHRDMKPANVVVDLVANSLKIVDFGLAYLRVEEDARLTQHGDVFGTPAYMSPEQCQGRETTAACDIYALGVMAFELVEGRLPFDETRRSAILIKHVTAQPPDMTPELAPARYRELVQHMLAKEPTERPTAVEVVAILGSILDELSVETVSAEASANAGVPAESTPVSGEADRETIQQTMNTSAAGRSRRWPVIAGALLVVVVPILLVAFSMGRDSEDAANEPMADSEHRAVPDVGPGSTDSIAAAQQQAFERDAAFVHEADPAADSGEQRVKSAAVPKVAGVRSAADEEASVPPTNSTEQSGSEVRTATPEKQSQKAEPKEADETGEDAGHRTIQLRY